MIYDKNNYIPVLKHKGYYDSLTGLPNLTYLKQTFYYDSKNEYSKGSFLIIELCNFKKIDNTYGYEVADELLINFGVTLKKISRNDAVIYKDDGDHFVIFIPYLTDRNIIKMFCDNILYVFSKPIFAHGKNIYLSLNIGAATYPLDADNLWTTLKKADLALYKAKQEGMNKSVTYNKKLIEEVTRKTLIYNNLRDAVYNNELEIYYQPQINQETNTVVKFEALLRWTNKELGSVSPGEFIPIAEETGVIIELGQWVLKEVCKQIRKWIDNGHFYVISLNVSLRQIQNMDFINNIINVLNEFDLSPNLIEIEITESILMFKSNIKILKHLRKIGIPIALDDFGTGYSSLSYLKTMPLDSIKIDKSFIDNIAVDHVSRDMVNDIIQLIKKLQLNVTVEGVESIEQVTLLKAMGCDIIQGYYFSKPLPAKLIEAKYMTIN